MTDLLAQFAVMLDQTPDASGGSTEMLVEQLGDEGELVRRCAITHQFTPDLLRVLDSSLGERESEESFDRLARLPLMTYNPDGLALHDRARQHLFAQWLKPDRIGMLREISRRLTIHFDQRVETAEGIEREKLARRHLFHFIAVDQDAGVAAFEHEFELFRDRIRYSACDNLMRMVREYDPILTPANRARVTYREAKLALDRGNPDSALELFTSIIAEPSVDPEHRANALNGIGFAHAARCRWRSAAVAFLKALRFAEEHEEARPYRCEFLQNLATVYRDTGHIEAAKQLLARSVATVGDRPEYRRISASVYNTLGTLHLRAGEPEEAIVNLRKSLEFLHEDDYARARVYNNLGLASLRVPDFRASEDWFHRSLGVKALAGDTVGQANTHINLVRLYREQQAPEKAAGAAATAADLFSRVFFWKEAGDANAMLARFHLDAKNLVEAARAIDAAFNAYDRAHADQEREILRREVLRHAGDLGRARLGATAGSADAQARAEGIAAELRRQADGRYVAGRTPLLAAILSLLMVGLGQLYNGDSKKALLMVGGSVVSTLGYVLLGEGCIHALFAPLIWFCFVVWSVIDASLVAAGKTPRW
jgi:tetratricopeptide (TPR) repeat protein